MGGQKIYFYVIILIINKRGMFVINKNYMEGYKMLKKLLCFSIILITSTLLLNISYATDVVMDLDSSNTSETENQTVDNTIYSSNSQIPETSESDTTTTDYEQPATTTTSDYDDDSNLSVSNMINIILIAVGVVLILLGIAIIIKIK